jgi:putative methyltransferase (TIGR04325 family)
MLRTSAILARDAYRFLAFPFSHFRGVYESFGRAQAAASRSMRIGYNHADLACQYRAELYLDLDNSEYPVLYHLDRILTDGCTVLDFGGNVGVHYLRYKKYLKLDKVRWIVCDMPEITKAGRAACAGMPNIAFVNDIDELDTARIDVFLASDALQYVESHDALLPRLIANGKRPRNILIDQLPLYDGPRFVTLQNGGLARYPQYVFNRAEYLAAITKLGYRLVDSWDCRNFSCIVPFHPDRSVRAYSGLYCSDTRT